MGVDLHFETPSKMDCTSANVLIKWVRIKVEYDLPDYYLKWTPNGSQVSPVEVDVNVEVGTDDNSSEDENSDNENKDESSDEEDDKDVSQLTEDNEEDDDDEET